MLTLQNLLPPDSNLAAIIRSLIIVEAVTVFIAAIIGFATGDTLHLFGECMYCFVTLLSSVQLLTISGLLLSAALWDKSQSPGGMWGSSSLILALIGFGFLFLAIDEQWMIHERLDMAIHNVFNLEENSLTDRIDDTILAIYAVLAIATIIAFRDTLARYKAGLPLLIAALVISFASIVADVVTNREDILSTVLGDSSPLFNAVGTMLAIAEEGLKLIAEGLLITLAYYVFTLNSGTSWSEISLFQGRAADLEQSPEVLDEQ